jgi:hypothetical protein
MPPVEEARAIFRRLGYEVSGNGPELLAERKWRTVRVTVTSSHTDRVLADGGSARETDYRLQCFVTWAEKTGELAGRLRRSAPDFEWAVIGVDPDSDDYEVVHGSEPVPA